MPLLERSANPGLPPNQPDGQPTGEPTPDPPRNPLGRIRKPRNSRYAELEDHELIHLLDSLDDETARARFRESIYISVIICMAIAWFLLYGPRILFHQPEYKDFVSAMKERDKTVTFLDTPPRPLTPPRPPSRTTPDRNTLQQLRTQPRATPAAPAPQQQQAAPTPTQEAPAQEQPRTAAPPVQSPALPLPSAPKPAPAPLVDAPTPHIAQNSPTAHDSMQDLARGARAGRPGEYGPSARPSAAGPLQAGAQILSDTMGVDFTAYMRRLHDDIQRNWDPLIPEEVRPPLYKKGAVGIRFTILPGGEIGNMVLETRSGDVALDKAAWSAITSEGNFPPLPREFHGPQLELRVGFFYNEAVQ